MIKQIFGEESISHTQVFEWNSANLPRLRKARQVKNKIIFFDIKRIVPKEFVLAGKTGLHTTVTFYGAA
jgi:hypothetical protein